MIFYLRLYLSIIIFSLYSVTLKAQKSYTINGAIKNDKGEPIGGAIVFLGSTQKITTSADDGTFAIGKLEPGTYELVVKMLGYMSYSRNIIVKPGFAAINVTLVHLPINLNEVKITATDPDWNDKFEMFKTNFLGWSKNGRNCKILNPKMLRLKYNRARHLLAGYSYDFLIIDNPLLGYRIKYWLRAFEHDYSIGVTNYTGEMIFEELKGSKEEEIEWQKNRLKAYQNSLTHFLKTVYAGKDGPLSEGFVTGRLIERPEDLKADGLNARMRPQLLVDDRPIRFDTIVSVVDSSLISLKFHSPLVITYAPEALKRKSNPYQGTVIQVLLNKNTTSILQLVLKEALIDSRGNFTDYRAFLIRGHWADFRVADQLPLDYEP